MRLGVLGGSFDPPHAGHVIAAVDACESLGLDRLVVIPTATQPLKVRAQGGATPGQRLEMARLAFGGDPRIEVSAMETDRVGLSYTVDTLEALAAANPGAELVLLLGSDALKDFGRWKNPDRIRDLARIAVLAREGLAATATPDERVATKMSGGAEIVTTRRVDVSSSEIRVRVAAGRSIRGFVAESVEEFISTAKLYRS
ncbi:MAG: nicotinate (nicotinamide) nucleotide adenylyltransferase [Gemmatimonadaceae bacterium]|nr:nicotinate (nicotinamide) nucleotide adenylyltransferase [Gemmatimonadaceae bacterium]